MSAADIAAQHYARQTAQGLPVTGQDLANVAQKSRSWGSQTLRKLREQDAIGEAVQSYTTGDFGPVPEPAQVVANPAQVEPECAEFATAAEKAEDVATGGRAVAWLAFALGTSLSVAANVLEAPNEPEAKIAWGAVPLLLLVSVEVLMRVRWRQGGQGWKVAGYFGAAVVALVAAVVSYGHQRELMLAMGDSVLNATIIPFGVDGLLLVGGIALLRGKKKGEA